MEELDAFQAHKIVHLHLLNSEEYVPDDVIHAWLVLTAILFPEDDNDTEVVIEFKPDGIVYDAIESASDTKPVLTLVPDIEE